jgi:hypothetical protein
MQLAVLQLGGPPAPWAAVCFALGVAGLLYAFRHTIFKRRHPNLRPLAELEERASFARGEINEITLRELYGKRQQGRRFYRGLDPVPAADLAALASVSAFQVRRMQKHG